MGAAAIVLAKERRVVSLFRDARAVSPESARTLTALGAHEGVGLRRLRHRVVIRDAGPDLFYLDEPTWTALRSARRRMALILLATMLGGAAATALVLWQR